MSYLEDRIPMSGLKIKKRGPYCVVLCCVLRYGVVWVEGEALYCEVQCGVVWCKVPQRGKAMRRGATTRPLIPQHHVASCCVALHNLVSYCVQNVTGLCGCMTYGAASAAYMFM